MADTFDFNYRAPTREGGVTFVGVNALTSDASLWEAQLGERLRAAGHGTLWWNLRGQPGSVAAGDTALDDAVHAADLSAVLDAAAPVRPVPVGLSIGGLFAARAQIAEGAGRITGLVLLNTLRVPGPRLEWINEAAYTAVKVGGPKLIGDLFAPMLFDEEWLAANRAGSLAGDYEPPPDDTPALRLLGDARAADWDVPWESVAVPTLVATGAKDRIFRVDADVEALTARLPLATSVRFERAGHMLPVEVPGALADAIVSWANGL